MNSNSVLVGKKSGRILNIKDEPIEFPSLDTIYSKVEQLEDFYNVFPEYSAFKYYITYLWQNYTEVVCENMFEALLNAIIGRDEYEDDAEEHLFNELPTAKMAEILYNNLEFFIK